MSKSKTLSFTEDDIRRDDLPRDVFELIHDLAYDHDGRDRNQYRLKAHAILRSRGKKACGKYRCSWEQHLVYVQVAVNRAVFEMNKPGMVPRQKPDLDYIKQCMSEAVEDLGVALVAMTRTPPKRRANAGKAKSKKDSSSATLG